jgi:hypothetical protein
MAFFIPVIDATAAILPGFASLWIGAFEANPGYVLLGLIALGGFLAWGAMLAVSVRDAMRPIWQESLANTPIPRGTPSGNTLFRVRTSPIYRGIFYALRQWILPFIFFVLIVVLVFVVFSRVFFAAGAAVGLLCSGSTKPSAIAGAERSFDFDSKTFCAPSGYIVEKGKRYRLTIAIPPDWKDKTIPSGPNGFSVKQGITAHWLALPFRRHLDANWYQIIARVKSYGLDEQPLQLVPDAVSPPTVSDGPGAYTASFTAQSNGELFLFVNDAVFALPRVTQRIYDNNNGIARVTIAPER